MSRGRISRGREKKRGKDVRTEKSKDAEEEWRCRGKRFQSKNGAPACSIWKWKRNFDCRQTSTEEKEKELAREGSLLTCVRVRQLLIMRFARGAAYLDNADDAPEQLFLLLHWCPCHILRVLDRIVKMHARSLNLFLIHNFTISSQ